MKFINSAALNKIRHAASKIMSFSADEEMRFMRDCE